MLYYNAEIIRSFVSKLVSIFIYLNDEIIQKKEVIMDDKFNFKKVITATAFMALATLSMSLLNASEINSETTVEQTVVSTETVSSNEVKTAETVSSTDSNVKEPSTERANTNGSTTEEVNIGANNDDSVKETNIDNTDSVVSNDTSKDIMSSTIEGNYVTQNLNLSIYQGALTYGQIFDIMDIEFTDELGQTYYPSEMIGVADDVVDGVESYEHIRNRKAAVSWGHKGTYEFRLQFDNSRYYNQTHVKYGYVDFSVTIVGEEVIDQTYVPDYNGVKGDMLTTTWKNGKKTSTIVTRKDGSTKFRSTYYNDSNNRIETKTYYDYNNHYTSKTYYNNDANKTIQKSYKYNKPGTSGYYTRYEYTNGVKDHAYRYEAGERVASYTFFKSGSAKGNIQFKYYWETVNGHAIKTRKQELNTSGNTIKNTYYSNSGKLTKVYKYNKPGTSGYYTRYMYDSNGVKERAYRYENGKQTASYTFFKSGSAKGDIQVKYYWKTVNGHLIKTRRQELNTSGHTIENRYYSDTGKLTKVYKYSKPGVSGYYTRFMYSSNGVKEKAYKYEKGNLINSYLYYQSGSAKGSIKSKYYYHTSHGKTIKDKRVDYNSHGHVTKTTRY